jgi:hypothetical protein
MMLLLVIRPVTLELRHFHRASGVIRSDLENASAASIQRVTAVTIGVIEWISIRIFFLERQK